MTGISTKDAEAVQFGVIVTSSRVSDLLDSRYGAKTWCKSRLARVGEGAVGQMRLQMRTLVPAKGNMTRASN
jgi:hypothetical protein